MPPRIPSIRAARRIVFTHADSFQDETDLVRLKAMRLISQIERHKPVTSQTCGTKIGHNDKLRDASAITVRPDGVSMATGELQRHSVVDR